MKRVLLANAAAFALFCLSAACFGELHGRALLFQCVVQTLTNELWFNLFELPFRGWQLYGVDARWGKLAEPARLRRVARWTCWMLLLLPGLVFAALALANSWGGGTLAQGLGLPLGWALFAPSLAAQALLFVAALVWGTPPLCVQTCHEALMAQLERRYPARAAASPSPTPPPAPPTHGGVDSLPHGLPEGMYLPQMLRQPQPCSPQHARHLELVRPKLREGEYAILSTAPVEGGEQPRGGHARLIGGLLLSLAAWVLYTALMQGDEYTLWLVLAAGWLGAVALVVLRAPARMARSLRGTDYIITNRRLHTCRRGKWQAVSFCEVERVCPAWRQGGAHGAQGDILLYLKSPTGPTPCLTNVEYAAELYEVLDWLVEHEQAR